jgi:hypothetical protein
MTTEIAVLNKRGIALAADSALTVTSKGPDETERKVYKTLNKLFCLSTRAPVGLMIYGDVDLIGIPWETVVKMYCQHLGDARFHTLKEYCGHFFAFLSSFGFSSDDEKFYILKTAHRVLMRTRIFLDRDVKAELEAGKPVDERRVNSLLHDRILSQHKLLEDHASKSSFSAAQRTKLRTKYRSPILEMADEVFEKRPLAIPDRSKLIGIVINACSVNPDLFSGIVFAGYGEKEILPSCYDYDVKGVMDGRVVVREKESYIISKDYAAAIVPFALSEEVTTFMKGVGERLSTFIKQTLRSMLQTHLPQQLIMTLKEELGLTEAQAESAVSIAQKMGAGSVDKFIEEIDEISRKEYVKPIMHATRFLPISELAVMAETLVNMVSFRNRVTLEPETVGGPIDVAIISKGDGFVWIRQKDFATVHGFHGSRIQG